MSEKDRGEAAVARWRLLAENITEATSRRRPARRRRFVTQLLKGNKRQQQGNSQLEEALVVRLRWVDELLLLKQFMEQPQLR